MLNHIQQGLLLKAIPSVLFMRKSITVYPAIG